MIYLIWCNHQGLSFDNKSYIFAIKYGSCETLNWLHSHQYKFCVEVTHIYKYDYWYKSEIGILRFLFEYGSIKMLNWFIEKGLCCNSKKLSKLGPNHLYLKAVFDGLNLALLKSDIDELDLSTIHAKSHNYLLSLCK